MENSKQMKRFNLYGLIFIIVIMVPNIIFAAKCKDGFENKYQNKLVETLEQIGRFTCFGTMIINIPHTIFGSGGIRKMNEQKFSGKGGVYAKARRDYLGGV